MLFFASQSTLSINYILNAVDKDEIDQILSENNIDTQEIEDYENLELEGDIEEREKEIAIDLEIRRKNFKKNNF